MVTISEYHAYLNKSTNKYKAIKTEYNGVIYDSKLEAKRAQELDLLEKAGFISNLRRQEKFPVEINGKKVFTYIADFVYVNSEGNMVVEDVKGVRTAMFNLKKKCVEAFYNITISIYE